MVQGLLGSNFSQILSPLSLMYSAVCRGLSPVCSSSESLQLQKYDLVTSMGRIRWECWLYATQSLDARDITWLATTYFELVSSACFFSVDRVVNSKYRRIILCLVALFRSSVFSCIIEQFSAELNHRFFTPPTAFYWMIMGLRMDQQELEFKIFWSHTRKNVQNFAQH